MKKSDSKLQVVGDKPAWDENLRLWLEQHARETGFSPAELAHHIGGSRSLWSDYLKCTYFGVPDPKNGGKIRRTENSKAEPMLCAYRARVEGPNSDKNSEFVKTIAWHQIRTAIQTSIEDNSINLAYGNFGWGKTRCKNEFINKKLKTPAVHILCSPNITTRYFLQKIWLELRLPKPSFTIPELEDELVKYLKDHPRLLVVDNANYLPSKALGSIAYIWEVSGAPVTLIGTQTLYDNFFSRKMTDDERGQLASRVAGKFPISGLDLGTVKGICERVLGKERATAQVVKTVWEKVGGKFIKREDGAEDALTANFRALEHRLRRLVRLMNLNPGKPIAELMDQADQMLLVA